MRIRFNGVIEVKKSGCSVCGKRRATRSAFVNSKTYILPSGQQKTFYVGRAEEVSDRDGKFLLSYVVTDQNGSRQVFEEVR